ERERRPREDGAEATDRRLARVPDERRPVRRPREPLAGARLGPAAAVLLVAERQRGVLVDADVQVGELPRRAAAIVRGAAGELLGAADRCGAAPRAAGVRRPAA